MKLCECGCSKVVKEGNRFIHGHNKPTLGKHLSEEHKRNISRNRSYLSGWHHTEESKKKMSDNHADFNGIKSSNYGKLRELNPRWGTHSSEETKKKIRDNHPRLSGENHPMWGRHHTDEAKERISKNHRNINGKNNPNYGKIGLHLTIETKEKLRIAMTGENHPMWRKHHSEESRKKISDNSARRGKPPSIKSGRGKGSYCNKGHWVRSSWERKVADWFYINSVGYKYELKLFYLRDNVRYRPDFYIPHLDLWIEVKGYMTGENIIQHRLFIEEGYKLLIIDKTNIDDLNNVLSFT